MTEEQILNCTLLQACLALVPVGCTPYELPWVHEDDGVMWEPGPEVFPGYRVYRAVPFILEKELL
jgi:hypothetical protein